MPTKIFIGNLGSNCRSEDLRELFEKYGKVTECDVLKNFGFVVCPLLKKWELHRAGQNVYPSYNVGISKSEPKEKEYECAFKS